MSADTVSDIVFRFRSPDRPGIIAAITPLLAERGWDIREADIYGDPDSETFFTRMLLRSSDMGMDQLEQHIRPLADEMQLSFKLSDVSKRMKVLIAVSKFGHCLTDLLHKWSIGTLPIEIVGVVSNHEDMRRLVEWHGVEFHHLPITKTTKSEQEARFKAIIEEFGADLTVLARYMQILSDDFSTFLDGRCINIHHSFLPSFKGAKPYHQAHKRGVKLIGATAHFVTPDLDEGPIIEQDTRRVTHALTAEKMVEIGREVEASVLSRAVKWYAEHRIFRNGDRTVVLAD